MTLRDDMLADRDALFLDPADFAMSVTCLLPDMTTTVMLNGVWRETDGHEQSHDHDLVQERQVVLKIKSEFLPADPYRCRWWRTDVPTVVCEVRHVVQQLGGLARLTLVKVTVVDRHARQGFLVVRP